MCLGGHLAYRCALDSRVKASVCYFATDIHSKTLAAGKNDDSLARAGDIKGELLMVGPFFIPSLSLDFCFVEFDCTGADLRKKRYARPTRRKGSDSKDAPRQGCALWVLRGGLGATYVLHETCLVWRD